jgi:phage pi2 protein 07
MSNFDSIDSIFQELKNKGCIIASYTIEPSKKWNNFHSEHSKIYYHPKMDKLLDVKSKKFCLLHEEEHNRIPYRYIVFWIISCIPIILLFFNLFTSNLFFLIPFFITVLVLIVAFKRLEEYDCDEFASIILRDKLKEQENPSKILEKALEKLENENMFHPSHEKRIEHIAKIVPALNSV